MRRSRNKLVKDEKGYTMIIALIIMLVGSLIIAPMLGYIGSGLRVGKDVHEERMEELYAADAGVEDAICQIQSKVPELPAEGEDPWQYSIGSINDADTNVSLGCVNNTAYRVISVAAGTSTDTTIDAIIRLVDFDIELNNAITSRNSVTLQPGGQVSGDVWLNGVLDNKGTIDGNIWDDSLDSCDEYGNCDNYGSYSGSQSLPPTELLWPARSAVTAFYRRQDDLRDEPFYQYDQIDLETTTTIGPLKRDGDLTIDNTGSSVTTPLGGTMFVQGNLTFAQPGNNRDYTINLNGQTIFATGTIYFAPQRISVSGSGCIIALGDITFQPAMLSSSSDFVLVMSVGGIVTFQPSGNFYGSLFGNTAVNAQPKFSLTNNYSSFDPPPDLNIPDLEATPLYQIQSWEIKL